MLSGTYRTTVGTMSYMYVLWTVVLSHKCEAPALWFDDSAVTLSSPSISACGAWGRFGVFVQSHSNTDTCNVHGPSAFR